MIYVYEATLILIAANILCLTGTLFFLRRWLTTQFTQLNLKVDTTSRACAMLGDLAYLAARGQPFPERPEPDKDSDLQTALVSEMESPVFSAGYNARDEDQS